MITFSRRSLLGLGLLIALLASTMLTASAMPNMAPLTAKPSVQATLHANSITHVASYTLHVTGKNFVAGSSVQFAVIDTPTLSVVYRGSTAVQPAYVRGEPIDSQIEIRWPNP